MPFKTKGQTPGKGRALLRSLEKQNRAFSSCGSKAAEACGFRAREVSSELVGGGVCRDGVLYFSTRGYGRELGGACVIWQSFVAREQLSSFLPQPVATASDSWVGKLAPVPWGLSAVLCGTVWAVCSGTPNRKGRYQLCLAAANYAPCFFPESLGD